MESRNHQAAAEVWEMLISAAIRANSWEIPIDEFMGASLAAAKKFRVPGSAYWPSLYGDESLGDGLNKFKNRFPPTKSKSL